MGKLMGKMVYQLLPDEDLSETQIYVTTQTYDRFAKEFADKWEWNPKTIKEIQKYNIKPFLKYAKRGGSVLLVSCQSGRDYSLLSKEDFSCLGIGFSYGLLAEAVKRVPEGLFVHLDLRSLPFMPASFDAVYADALMHTPKKDMKEVLRDFRIFLKPKGVVYLSLRVGKGNVLVMEDLGGKRYITLFKRTEILEMVKSSGFKIMWSQASPHTDSSLPSWFSLIGKKM